MSVGSEKETLDSLSGTVDRQLSLSMITPSSARVIFRVVRRRSFSMWVIESHILVASYEFLIHRYIASVFHTSRAI